MTDFLELAARVEAATEGSHELDLAIVKAIGWSDERPYRREDGWREPLNFTASLDAAMTLVPEGWRIGQLEENWRSARWHCHTTQRPSANLIAAFDEGETIGYDSEESEAATPALALTAAALRAHAALHISTDSGVG